MKKILLFTLLSCMSWMSVHATTCGSAEVINPASLPISGQAIVCGAGNDLNSTTVPTACGAASNSYKGGNEGLYTFTPTTTGTYTVSISGVTYTSIFVYAGCPTSGGTCVNSIGNSATSKNLAVALTAGTNYYIWFDTWPTPNSPCPGTFSLSLFVPPVGDNCSNAQDLASLTSPYAGTTVGYVNDITTSCLDGTAGDRVFFMDVPNGYTLFIGQSANAYDSKHRIAFGGACPGTTEINTGYVGNFPTTITSGNIAGCLDDNDLTHYYYNNASGVTQRVYWVQDNYNTSSGTFTLEWQLTAPPACPDVTALNATNFSTTNVDISWGAAAGATNYLWEIQPVGTPQGTAGAISSGSGAAITASASGTYVSGTTYTLYVNSDCGGSTGNYQSYNFTLNIPPANDNCGAAITLASCSGAPQSLAGTTVNSTVDAVYSSCGAGGNNTTERGVWYTYVGDDNEVTLTTCDGSGTGYDSRLTVYTGSCGSFTCVTANDDMSPACGSGSFRSEVTFNAYTGTTYYIFVHGYQAGTGLSATGAFILNWTCAPLCLPIPSNDDCAGATSLTVSATCTPVSGNNTCASAPLSNPSCFSAFATLPDVWYSFTATSSSVFLNITNGTATSLGYAVYDACGGTQLFCNTGVTSGADNSLTGLTSGNTYLVQVLSAAASAGTFDICVKPVLPPANDDCSGAITLVHEAAGSCTTTSSTLIASTASMAACAGSGVNDVWFKFVATSANATINVTASPDVVTQVFQGGNCGALGTSIACSDPETVNLTGLSVGTTYFVRVNAWSTFTTLGSFNICVTTPPPAPVNDNCANAIVVYSGYTVTGFSTANAVVGADITSCVFNDTRDVWFSYTPT
ncbi:MAG: hypothetical protein H6579_09160, partial [Chitinophagales bacterium]|nr:hypothetical protein [Chitinophagales bacterium]